jgi:hypothetical protein
MGAKRKPTDARECECGKTLFAYTSLVWIAIVDVEDGWLLRDYKWNATGKSLDRVFYAKSWRYGKVTGKSGRLHQAVTGHQYKQPHHKDGNGHNCMKGNLRECTPAN